MVTIEWDPADLRGLNSALLATMPENFIDQDLEISGKKVKREASVYPSDFPGNTYRRTGRLKAGWYSRMVQGHAVAVGNVVDYSDWVQGDAQIELHTYHGWRRLRSLIEEELDYLAKRIEARLERIWR